MGRVETVTLDGKEYFENMMDKEDKETKMEYFENMMDDKDKDSKMEYFENVRNQEEQEPVHGIASPPYPPAMAVAEVNAVAQQTALRSLMTQTGAILEGPSPGGYALDEAYAPPHMAAYTSVNYR
jgi:hypothetical protein